MSTWKIGLVTRTSCEVYIACDDPVSDTGAAVTMWRFLHTPGRTGGIHHVETAKLFGVAVLILAGFGCADDSALRAPSIKTYGLLSRSALCDRPRGVVSSKGALHERTAIHETNARRAHVFRRRSGRFSM